MSTEVAYEPVDLSKPHDVTVTPSPSTQLELAKRPRGIVTEVHGPSALVAGIYGSAVQQVVRFHVTPPGVASYVVTVRFRGGP